jgi:hypothetical protein
LLSVGPSLANRFYLFLARRVISLTLSIMQNFILIGRGVSAGQVPENRTFPTMVVPNTVLVALPRLHAKSNTCVTVSQHYLIDLITTWSHGLLEYKGRIICNAKDDQVLVDQFFAKNTSATLKKYDGGGADEIRRRLDRFSTAAVPHKFDAARRRNSAAPGSNL